MLPVIHHLEHINNVPTDLKKNLKFCSKSSFFEFEEMEFKLDV